MRIAFCEPLTLELNDTHVQLPICGGGKPKSRCSPASNPQLLAVIIGKILELVFRPKKPPRFSLKPKHTHWRTVRRMCVCTCASHGTVGCGARGCVDGVAVTSLTPTLPLPLNQACDVCRLLSYRGCAVIFNLTYNLTVCP